MHLMIPSRDTQNHFYLFNSPARGSRQTAAILIRRDDALLKIILFDGRPNFLQGASLISRAIRAELKRKENSFKDIH